MVRLLLTGVAILFLPGYALTLAVFPGGKKGRDETDPSVTRRYRESTLSSLDPVERIALGVGFSVCLIPVYGYVVGFGVAGFAYDPQTVIVLVSTATVLATVLAIVRHAMSPSDIVVPSPFAQLARSVAVQLSALTPRRRILNIAVIVALVLATANLTAAVALPPEGPEYTTAVLLTENDDGELIADEYPNQLQTDETADFVLRLENHESQDVDYHVVVQLQRVSSGGSVTEISTLDQFNRTLARGETWDRSHSVTSTMSGERIRLAYLVYKGDVPTEPTLDNAYRNLTLWVGSEPAAGDDATNQSASAALSEDGLSSGSSPVERSRGSGYSWNNNIGNVDTRHN